MDSEISTVLQELEGFTYAIALDLNVGYYTIRLDHDSPKICTIIFCGEVLLPMTMKELALRCLS
jgi:hypothetical protein